MNDMNILRDAIDPTAWRDDFSHLCMEGGSWLVQRAWWRSFWFGCGISAVTNTPSQDDAGLIAVEREQTPFQESAEPVVPLKVVTAREI